jgi:S-adenosylmethionine hydrolase
MPANHSQQGCGKMITLLTDFGLKDGYAGILKGVIWTIAPKVKIVDLSHVISPQAVIEGALTLARCVPYFPPGSVHIAVIDPGVGTSRRPIAGQIGAHYFVGPDNGIFSLLIEAARLTGETVDFYALDQPAYWLPTISHVFHGRDIFAPVGAHLANGVTLERFGTKISDPVTLHVPKPVRSESGWTGEVIHVDNFGNLATNITADQLAPLGQVEIQIAGKTMLGVALAFGDRGVGEAVALIDSSGWLSLAIVNGSAAQSWNAGVGAAVKVTKTG